MEPKEKNNIVNEQNNLDRNKISNRQISQNHNNRDRVDNLFSDKKESKNFEKAYYNKNRNCNQADRDEISNNNNRNFNKPSYNDRKNFPPRDREDSEFYQNNNNRNFNKPSNNFSKNFNRRDNKDQESNNNERNFDKPSHYHNPNFNRADRESDSYRNNENYYKNPKKYHQDVDNEGNENPNKNNQNYKKDRRDDLIHDSKKKSHSPPKYKKNTLETKTEVNSLEKEKMSFEILEKLKCSICFEFINNPMECQHCNNIFCFSCVMLHDRKCRFSNCPLCRSQAKFEKSVFALRLINSISIECPNKCGENTTKGDLDKHLAGCKNKMICCVLCNKEHVKTDFLQHLITFHEDNLILKYDKSSDKNILKNP
jgi:hypothetical protein